MTRAALWLYAAALYAFIFAPVAVLALFSFQGGRLPIPPFDGPSLRWYGEVLADPDLRAALINSVVVATLSAAVATALGFFAALGLARAVLPSTALARALMVAPLTVSGLVIGLGLLIALNASGVRPSLWTVGIGHVTLNLPLAFAILYAATGPRQLALERAARDLGAREWQVVPFVTARILAPALAASFCLCVTLSWDEFIVAFLLSRFDVTLPVEIWSQLRSGLSPKSNAVGSLVFLVSIVAVLLAELLLLRRARR